MCVCVAVFVAHQDVRRLVHESPSYISHLLNCVHTGSYYVYCISLWLQCRDSVQFFRNKKNASSAIYHMTNPSTNMKLHVCITSADLAHYKFL